MKILKTEFQRRFLKSVLTLFAFAAFLNASTAQGVWIGSQVVVCNDDDIQQFQYILNLTFSDLMEVGETMEVCFAKYNTSYQPESGNDFDTDVIMTFDNDGINDLSQINFDVDFNSEDIVVRNVTQGISNQTESIGSRPEGHYGFIVRIKNGSTVKSVHGTTLPIQYTFGQAPLMEINGRQSKQVIVLEDCDNGQVLLKNLACHGEHMHLAIREYDPLTGGDIGTNVSGHLSSSQRNALENGGLNIQTYTANGNTISMTAGKTYRVILAFNDLSVWKHTVRFVQVKAGDYDLLIRDHKDDEGMEPWHPWTGDVTNSPDLWNIHNEAGFPGIPDHEPEDFDNPDHVTVVGNTNKMFVRIENLGCVTTPNNLQLRFFWTRAQAKELWDVHWMYDLIDNGTPYGSGTVPMGSEITIPNPSMTNPYSATSDPFVLPSLDEGEVWKMPWGQAVDWFPPNPDWYDANNGEMNGKTQNPILCLLTLIQDPNGVDDLSWSSTPQQVVPFARNHNNVATRNFDLQDNGNFLVDNGDGSWSNGFSTVHVGNESMSSTTATVCLDLVADANVPGNFADYGVIEIATTDGLYSEWVENQGILDNVTNPQSTIFQLIDGSHGCIQDARIPAGADEQIGVRFTANGENFPEEELAFSYALRLTYDDGTIGSESTIQVVMPPTSPIQSQKRGTKNEQSGMGVPGLIVFPNPADDHFLVSFGSNVNLQTETFDLEILDLSGKTVRALSDLQTDQNHRINVKSLSPGIYMVRAKAGSQTYLHKIVRQ